MERYICCGTAYTPDDVVYYIDGTVGSSYICVANTTGNTPSSGGTAHASWNYLAKGQAVSPTTTQGDLIVRGASADERLGLVLEGIEVNSSANGYEFADGGKILQIQKAFGTGILPLMIMVIEGKIWDRNGTSIVL